MFQASTFYVPLAALVTTYYNANMPPAVVPVEDGGGGGAKKEAAACQSCHVAWSSWLSRLGRCLLSSTLLPCHAAIGLSPAAPDVSASSQAIVRGTLFLPSTGDRRVRLFLHEEHAESAAPAPILVLDLPAGLVGADIAPAGRIVLECQREWAGSGGALLESPKWLVYCNGMRVGFAKRREAMSDGEGWAMEKLWAVSAGAGRLPGGGVDYLRGRFERIVGSADAESFHLVEPIGWVRVNGDGGLSIFFHRI